jgi:DNA-binding MarR family transcriptional regulator
MNEFSVVWLVIHAGHCVEHRLETALAGVGLSLAKLGALRHLIDSGEPLALGQLAERIACVKSNVTQLVDRLENDGLVKRVPDPNDRRSVLALVTDEGRERYRAGAAALSEAEEELLYDMPADVREQLSALLSSFVGVAAP